METTTLKLKAELKCSAQRAFLFLSDQGKYALLTDAETILPNEIGGEFSFFGGAVTGRIIELIKPTKIIWEWSCSVVGWPEDHKSIVTFDFYESTNNSCTLYIMHTDIPKESEKLIKDGWVEYCIKPLKKKLPHRG